MSIVHMHDINFKLTVGRYKSTSKALHIIFDDEDEICLKGYMAGQDIHLPSLIKDIKTQVNKYFREKNIALEVDFRKVYHHLYDHHIYSEKAFISMANRNRNNTSNRSIKVAKNSYGFTYKKLFKFLHDAKDKSKFELVYFKPSTGKSVNTKRVYQFPILLSNIPQMDYRELMKSDLTVFIPLPKEIHNLVKYVPVKRKINMIPYMIGLYNVIQSGQYQIKFY